MSRSSWRDDLVTVAAGAWLIGGLFLDGWAHNAQKPETFFSPWHGVFYAGFAVTAAWMVWLVRRGGGTSGGLRAGLQAGVSAVPDGYRLGLVGLAIFAVGGAFDMAWHELFGVEVDIEALLSPSHLVLFAGALLVVTSPFRAASIRVTAPSPPFRELLPAVLSLTLVTALIAFFFLYVSPFTETVGDVNTDQLIGELFTSRAIGAILVTTMILMGPALVLVRRWTPPRGVFTLLFGSVALLLTALDGFELVSLAVAGIVGGVAADVFAARLRPSLERRGPYLAFAAAVPPVLWLTYFALIERRSEVVWSVELWWGVSVMAGFAGLGLAVVSLPPRTVRPLDGPVGEPSPATAAAQPDSASV